MRIAVRHRFVRLFGGGIEGHLRVGLGRFAIGHLGIGTIGRARRGEQHVPRRMGACSFQKLEGALKVRLEIGAWVVDRIAHPCLCREVDDDLGAVRLEEPHQASGLLDLAHVGRESFMPPQPGMTCLFELDAVIIAQRVDSDHAITICDQSFTDMHPDETCGACDNRGGKVGTCHGAA